MFINLDKIGYFVVCFFLRYLINNIPENKKKLKKSQLLWYYSKYK